MAKVSAETKTAKDSGSKEETVKKTDAKLKTSDSKKNDSVKSEVWESLAKELRRLIPKLDEEGLAFLVKQSHTHLYNMKVDAFNSSLINGNERKKENSVRKMNLKSLPQGNEDQWFSEVNKSASGSNYYIVYNNEWIAFTEKEIAAMVKIVFSQGADMEIRERLFIWLSRERSDLLHLASIGDRFNDKLKSLVSLLKNNFRLKTQTALT